MRQACLILQLIIVLAAPLAQGMSCQDLFNKEVISRASSQAPGTKLIQSIATVPGWYEMAEEIPTKGLDPVYFEIATFLGGRVILGGSDLAEILIGNGKKSANSEMNVLVDDVIWKSIESKLPGDDSTPKIKPELNRLLGAFSNRISFVEENFFKAVNVRLETESLTPFGIFFDDPPMHINIGELNRELSIYASNDTAGRPLAESHPVLVLPLKGDYLIEIESGPQGKKARVHFRNNQARERYLNRTLALPSEKQIPTDWHVGLRRSLLNHVLSYNLIIATRGMKAGWTLTPTTRSLLATWIRHFNHSTEPNNLAFIPHLDQDYGNDYWALQGITKTDFQTTIDQILAAPNSINKKP